MAMFRGDRRGRGAGRSGKRAGADFRPPHDAAAQGMLTCEDCGGAGYQTRPILESDEESSFDGQEDKPCRRCGGTGTVRT
ncbi:hypothetical protein [Frankia sp. CiP3]|uniref:hypothetical protein n=1 Tax=Frankia sp. CiP3 TaxID=2880971 RepID=UPI001EF63DEF|nr:hypothetical protein [Frankia sp. CiP3]